MEGDGSEDVGGVQILIAGESHIIQQSSLMEKDQSREHFFFFLTETKYKIVKFVNQVSN